jgi:3-oxoacyl-[acyl-carrier protein] reductase
MDLGLRGKKAIVTGATKGIGRAIVELLAAEGVDIGLCARSEEEVESAVAELKAKGVNATGAALNVRDGDAYKAWLEAAAKTLGGCDIFIPNVSGGGGFDSEKNWVRNFEIDVLHTVRGCETLTPQLKKSGAGAVVVIASTNAVETFVAPMGFNAMKAALVTYSKQLSQFLGKDGVRVNTVSPGLYDSTIKKIPSGRMGTPQEVARVVAFLASPAASLVTGTNVVADNGFTKRVQL